MDVFVSVLLLQSRHHPFLVIFVKFVFHLLSCHSERSRRIPLHSLYDAFRGIPPSLRTKPRRGRRLALGGRLALCLFFFRLRFLLLVFLLRFFDQAHIRNVNRPFTFRNLAARVILRLPQVLLNNTHPFNQHPLLLRQHLQNFAARTAEIPRDHFDVVALFYVKLDPVHKVNVAQSSSLLDLQASRLRDFHSQDGCATKTSSFITTPPAPARRSS